MQNERLELTLKAFLMGVLLSIVFCGANVYLGLKIGTTISASIPAAILSMGFLRFFKKYSALENSIAQTTASVGEAMAMTVIFVFPALLILNVWHEFHYSTIAFVLLPGTVIGVVYSVMLRKVLLKDPVLKFPEGFAIGKVLQATENVSAESGGGKILLLGMLVSALTNFCQAGFQVLSGAVFKFVHFGNKVAGTGLSFSIAIMSAGYLIGFMNMYPALISMILSWFVIVPWFSQLHSVTDSTNLMSTAFTVWKTNVRPIGVGIFISSGLLTMVILISPIYKGIKESIKAIETLTKVDANSKDIPLKYLSIILLLACVPIMYILFTQVSLLNNYSPIVNFILSILVIIIMLIFGFAIAAVSGYFAGLAGSTISPLSGLLFIAVIFVTAIVEVVSNNAVNASYTTILTTIILFVAVISGMAGITNSSIQDYKSGQIVSSTPYKQELVILIAAVIISFIAPIFIILIFNAYGIAGIVPHVGMDPNKTLSAPQASAVATLANNLIGGDANWKFFEIGAALGLCAFIFDRVGSYTGKFRFSMIMFGMGFYLPPDTVCALLVGAIIGTFINFAQDKVGNKFGDEVKSKLQSKSNMLICGLIAGESLMGLILAIPFIMFHSTDALKLSFVNIKGYESLSEILSIIVTILVFRTVYKVGTKVTVK
ncbi:MAG: oligopeptide transporter, OPT family [Burkholderiales bacterium]|nr:oligopeptide transporter, OPT family [Burkholderiales bacterium]